MNSTLPSASSKALRTSGRVWPTNCPISALAGFSTTLPSTRSSDARNSPMRRAMTVLPLPDGPEKRKKGPAPSKAAHAVRPRRRLSSTPSRMSRSPDATLRMPTRPPITSSSVMALGAGPKSSAASSMRALPSRSQQRCLAVSSRFFRSPKLPKLGFRRCRARMATACCATDDLRGSCRSAACLHRATNLAREIEKLGGGGGRYVGC